VISGSIFFSLSSWALALIIFVVVAAVTGAGVLLGRRLREHHETLREPFGAAQGALLGVVALILAFGLTLAVGRYEDRRSAVVADANAIGTTYLRAQLLAEPVRTRSLGLLRGYTDLALRMSHEVPGSLAMRQTAAQEDAVQRRLWRLAGQALGAAPIASGPRLYVDALNEMIDQQTVRISALNNRVPGSVLLLEVVGAAIALGLLGLYLSVLGRGMWPMAFATVLVTMLLLVTFDLDRPTRGLITIPDTPYTSLLASMKLPPAASP
jgi:ABC-type multidrug transport system fused ATPase/permease subunit